MPPIGVFLFVTIRCSLVVFGSIASLPVPVYVARPLPIKVLKLSYTAPPIDKLPSTFNDLLKSVSQPTSKVFSFSATLPTAKPLPSLKTEKTFVH